MDENAIKNRISQLIQTQESLCPQLFGNNQKLRPEVKKTLLNIVDFGGELITKTFKEIKLDDILLCGSCASFLYNPESEIDLVMLWKMNPELLSAESLEEKLKLTNGGFRNRGFNFNIYGRFVNYQNYALCPGGSGIYSVKQDKWLKFPQQKHFTYSVSELFHGYSDLNDDVNRFMQSLPKTAKGFLAPEDCLKAENFYQLLYNNALEAEKDSKEQEYDIEYQSFRMFRRLGNAEELRTYIRNSYSMYFA